MTIIFSAIDVGVGVVAVVGAGIGVADFSVASAGRENSPTFVIITTGGSGNLCFSLK